MRDFARNSTRHRKHRAKTLREMTSQLDQFSKSAMSRAVQHSVFWRIPGKVANAVEQQARQHVRLCTTRLDDTMAEHEKALREWWAKSHEKALRRAQQKRQKAELARRTSPP